MTRIRTPRLGTRPATLLLVVSSLVVAGGQLGTATAAHASTTNDTVGATTQRMTGPSLNTTQVGWYSKGSHLNLQCYERGQSVKGYYSPWIPGGWDNLWYKVSDGYWVADVDINTGSNNPVTPACGTTSGRAKGQTIGYNTGISGYCTWGALAQWHAATGYYPYISGDAKDWASSARSHGWTVVADAQPRSIVVFQPYVQGAYGLGHVAWVTGTERRSDGLYITIVEMNGTAGFGKWDTRTVKDVVGMSYILAP